MLISTCRHRNNFHHFDFPANPIDRKEDFRFSIVDFELRISSSLLALTKTEKEQRENNFENSSCFISLSTDRSIYSSFFSDFLREKWRSLEKFSNKLLLSATDKLSSKSLVEFSTSFGSSVDKRQFNRSIDI